MSEVKRKQPDREKMRVPVEEVEVGDIYLWTCDAPSSDDKWGIIEVAEIGGGPKCVTLTGPDTWDDGKPCFLGKKSRRRLIRRGSRVVIMRLLEPGVTRNGKEA